MDPIVLLIIGILVVVIVLRIFFGLAKIVFKLGLAVVLAIIIWRVFFLKG